ncbi:MAG: hypothetical protein AB8B92_02150 [Gammaproteobacteria bacterium]
MIDCKCSFSITLIKEDFSCEKAQAVARRAGPDTACASESGSQRCQQVYAELRAVGLPAFDAEDDLLKTPASVFSKIQFGGLLGLANRVAIGDSSDKSKVVRVDNIFQLLEQAVARYESVNNIPYMELVDTMTTFKIKRKR